MKVVQALAGYILAVIVMVILGAGAHAYFNQGDLAALGADYTIGERISWIVHDIVAMAPLFGAIMGAGLLIAFLVAGIVSRWMLALRPVVFIVAGAAAVAVALIVMGTVFEITPIASTRDMDGFIAQAIAGALAGLTFVLVKRSA